MIYLKDYYGPNSPSGDPSALSNDQLLIAGQSGDGNGGSVIVGKADGAADLGLIGYAVKLDGTPGS